MASTEKLCPGDRSPLLAVNAAVGEILKNAKLEELLEHVGVWKP